MNMEVHIFTYIQRTTEHGSVYIYIYLEDMEVHIYRGLQ